jgi:hypothetical protein
MQKGGKVRYHDHHGKDNIMIYIIHDQAYVNLILYGPRLLSVACVG